MEISTETFSYSYSLLCSEVNMSAPKLSVFK